MSLIKLTEELYGVVVPEGKEIFVSATGYLCMKYPRQVIDHENKFKLLGTCTRDEIDFDVKPYIEECESLTNWYKDYTDKTGSRHFHFKDAKNKSFRSLLTSKEIYFDNPMEEPGMHKLFGASDIANSEEKEWQSYQSKVITKLVILEKL